MGQRRAGGKGSAAHSASSSVRSTPSTGSEAMQLHADGKPVSRSGRGTALPWPPVESSLVWSGLVCGAPKNGSPPLPAELSGANAELSSARRLFHVDGRRAIVA